jgi:hypothetical protein
MTKTTDAAHVTHMDAGTDSCMNGKTVRDADKSSGISAITSEEGRSRGIRETSMAYCQ